MVSATLQIATVRIWPTVKPRSAFTVVARGARLNQTTNVRKKANQVRCNVRYLPWNDQRSPSMRVKVNKQTLSSKWNARAADLGRYQNKSPTPLLDQLGGLLKVLNDTK